MLITKLMFKMIEFL